MEKVEQVQEIEVGEEWGTGGCRHGVKGFSEIG